MLGAFGDPQLYRYLLHFGRLGHLGTLNFTAMYYTLATLACGPHPWGRSWGRIGVPELPKGCFGMPKSSQSGPNMDHFMFSREDFKGRVAFNGTLTLRIIGIARE